MFKGVDLQTDTVLSCFPADVSLDSNFLSFSKKSPSLFVKSPLLKSPFHHSGISMFVASPPILDFNMKPPEPELAGSERLSSSANC